MTGLEELPARMDHLELQIVQLRSENHEEFSAVRHDIQALDTRLGSVDTRLGTVDTRLGAVETRLGAVDTRLGAVETKLGAVETNLGAVDTRLGYVETKLEDARRETRVLFEEVLGRSALVGEQLAGKKPTSGKPKKR